MIGYLENRLSFLDKLYSPSNKEVYTPLSLVNEILDKLPKEVWDDINLKWLNPAVKNGVFLGAIILRLVKNYTEKGIFNTEQEAYNHVVQNQIYGYALSSGALRTANKLIYGSAKYKGNIIYGNILEEQINMKFDVVIGNPPYQNNSETTQKPLWPKFMNIANKLTKDDGYTSLIVPKNWLNSPLLTDNNRKGSDLERTRMLNITPYNLIYLAVDTPKKYFEVGSDFTYYIVHKIDHNDSVLTKVEYLENKEIRKNRLQLNNFDRIVHNFNNKTLSIVNKVFNPELEQLKGDVTENPNGFAGSGHMKKEPDTIYKFKNISTSAHYKKNKFFYSKIDHPNRTKRKVIFSVSGYPSPFYDNGKLGTCHHGRSIFVKDEEEGNKIIQYLNSKLVKFLTQIYPSSHLAIGVVKIVDKLPKIDTSIDMTDENIYNYFNLTQEEIDYIEANA